MNMMMMVFYPNLWEKKNCLARVLMPIGCWNVVKKLDWHLSEPKVISKMFGAFATCCHHPLNFWHCPWLMSRIAHEIFLELHTARSTVAGCSGSNRIMCPFKTYMLNNIDDVYDQHVWSEWINKTDHQMLISLFFFYC